MLPADGAFPTFIEWPDGFGPARNMPESDGALERLVIRHPRAEEIAATLAGSLRDDRVRFEKSGQRALRARIATSGGLIELA